MKACRRYSELADGQWFAVARRGVLIACCWCGLVHRWKPRIVKGNRIELAAYRLPQNTGGVRAGMKRRKRGCPC